ncbi:MAG: enoyl-CoA hydratase-related protein [Rhodospirillales bacterium]
MAESSVFLETPKPGVRLIRLSRPARRNAFTRDMVDAFHVALDDVQTDADCRVVIITGDGAGFCSGQDMQAANDRNVAGGARIVERMFWQERFATMAGRMRGIPKPFVAAINGAAAGAGMAIALAADIRVATPTARFLVASVRIGLSGGESGLSYFLPRLIGASRAFEVLLTGRPVEAAEAERIGLISAIVPADQLMESALQRCDMILANSPFSVAQTKQLMWENLDAGVPGGGGNGESCANSGNPDRGLPGGDACFHGEEGAGIQGAIS